MKNIFEKISYFWNLEIKYPDCRQRKEGRKIQFIFETGCVTGVEYKMKVYGNSYPPDDVVNKGKKPNFDFNNK